MKTEEKTTKRGAEHYKAPTITPTDIAAGQNILQSGSAQGTPPDAIGEIWW